MTNTTVSISVSGEGIPTIPFVFNAVKMNKNNETTLPYYGLSKEEVVGSSLEVEENGNKTHPANPMGSNVTQNSPTEHNDYANDKNIANSVKQDGIKRTEDRDNLTPGDLEDYDYDDDDDIALGNLLYVIPIAIIIVLLVVFIIVIIFTR